VIAMARIESQIDTWTQPEAVPCSVLWFITREGDELAAVFEHLVSAVGPLSLRAIVGHPDHRKRVPAQATTTLAAIVGREAVLEARLSYSGVLAFREAPRDSHSAKDVVKSDFGSRDEAAWCEVVDVDVADGRLWAFVLKRYGMDGGLFFGPAVDPGRWLDAAIMCETIGPFRPFGSLPDRYRLSYMLEQMFLQQVIADGGVGLSWVSPEICGTGIALTGSPAAIDELERHLGDLKRLSDVDVKHSMQLGPRPGSAWPI